MSDAPHPPTFLTPAQIQQAAEEKRARQYRAVFGYPPGPGEDDGRSEAQIAVWSDLAELGYDSKPVFVPDRAGAFCAIRGALTDGRRALWLHIKNSVLFQPKIQK